MPDTTSYITDDATTASRHRDYLSEYDAAPEAEKYPLVQKWIREEPLAFFAQLRAERPVLETPECTLVANFVDVRDMLQMPGIFTVDLYKPKMGVTSPTTGYLMAHDDDALHYREKSLMQGLLNRDDMPRVRRMVAKVASETLDAADGRIDLADGYGRIVPVTLVQQYFGLDGIDKADLIRWSYWNQYDAFNNQPFDMHSDAVYDRIVEEHDRASKELKTYIGVLMLRKTIRVKVVDAVAKVVDPARKLVRRVLGRPAPARRDTMVTRMIRTKFAASADFPAKRVAINAGGLLIGAIETTNQAVVQAVDYFLQRPALLKTAKDKAREADTTAFDAMVWEALRFVPIRPDIFRQASEDYTIAKGTLHETRIREGTIVRLLIQSAMSDPYAYENPDAFDPDRTFYHNFCFGLGTHQCLGKYVGMEMVPEMVRQALLREDISRDGPISYVNPDVRDTPGPFPETYEVTWGQTPGRD